MLEFAKELGLLAGGMVLAFAIGAGMFYLVWCKYVALNIIGWGMFAATAYFFIIGVKAIRDMSRGY